MKSQELDRLKYEYLRKKIFAVHYDEREKSELLELRNKINNLKSTL